MWGSASILHFLFSLLGTALFFILLSSSLFTALGKEASHETTVTTIVYQGCGLPGSIQSSLRSGSHVILTMICLRVCSLEKLELRVNLRFFVARVLMFLTAARRASPSQKM